MCGSQTLSHLDLTDLLMSFSITAPSEFIQSEKAQFAHTQKSLEPSRARGAPWQHELVFWWWAQTDARRALLCLCRVTHQLEHCAAPRVDSPRCSDRCVSPFTPKKPRRSWQPIREHFHRVYLLQSPGAGILTPCFALLFGKSPLCLYAKREHWESRWQWLIFLLPAVLQCIDSAEDLMCMLF